MIRNRKLLRVFAGLFLMILAGMTLLSHIDFGDGTAGMVHQAIEASLGLQLEMEAPRGNPLTGFSAGKTVLRDGEKTVLSADSIEVRLSLASIARKGPVISRLVLTGLTTSRERVLDLLETVGKPQNGDTSRIELQNLVVEKAILETPAGPVTIRKAEGHWKNGSTALELDLSAGGHTVGVRGNLQGDARDLRLSDASGEIDGNPFDLAGDLYPRTELKLHARYLPMGMLPLLFPSLDPARFGGGADLSAQIVRDASGLEILGDLDMEEATAGGFHFTRTRSSLTFREGVLSFTDIAGFVNGSPVQGELTMRFREGDPLFWSIRAKGQELEIARWKDRFSWLEPLSGDIPGLQVSLEGPSASLQGAVALEGAHVGLMGKNFRDLTGRIGLELPRKVSLDLEGLWGSSPIVVTGKMVPAGDPGLFIDVTSRAFCLKDVRELNEWLGKMVPEGDMAGTLKVRGTGNRPELDWELRSDRIRLKGELLEKMTLGGSTQGDRLEIAHAAATWRGSRIEAEGALQGLSGQAKSHLSMTGTLKGLPLERFDSSPSLKGIASGTWSLSGAPDGIGLTARLTVDQPRWGDLQARKLVLDGSWKDRQIVLKKIEAPGLLGGSMTAEGTLAFGQDGVTSFDISGLLSQADLSYLPAERVPGKLSLSGKAEGPFRLTGNSRAPLFRVEAATRGLSLFGVTLKEASGVISWSREGLSLGEWTVPLWGGTVSLGGEIFSSDGETGLGLKGAFRDLDLLLASQTLKLPVKLSGQATGTFTLDGQGHNPTLTLEAGAPKFYLGGFGSSEARLTASGPLSDIVIDSFETGVGQSRLTGKGQLSLSEPWKFSFDVGGKDLDLAALIHTASSGSGFAPVGKGNIRAKGTLSADGLSGEGQLDTPSVELWGLQFQDLQIPFVLLEGYLTVEEGRGTLYGGSLETQWTMGLREEQWGGNIFVKGADLSQAVRDAFSPEGDISGTADFRFHLSGAYGKAFLLDGTGALEVRDGQVSGFSRQQELAEVLDFRSLSASFSIDGKTLYLLPGSRISAPAGNRLYRYVSIDGSIVPGGALDLSGYGDVNLQALNAFLGGLQGLFAAGEDSEEQMQQFLSGLLGGMTNTRNFQEVEFAIQGDWETPRLTELRTVAAEGTNAFSPIPVSPSDPDETKSSNRISLKLEIPTGEGGDSETSGMGDQIKQQILEQILREILGPEDDDNSNGF